MDDKQAHERIRDEMHHLRKTDRSLVPPFADLLPSAVTTRGQRWHTPVMALAAAGLVAIGVALWLTPTETPTPPVLITGYDVLLDPSVDMPTDFLLEDSGDRLASATPEFMTTLPDYLIPEDPEDVY